MLLYQARDQARLLGLLDEGCDVCSASRRRLVAANRLLHGAELALKDSGARHLGNVLEQARPQAGQNIDLVLDELVEGAVQTRNLDQFSVLDVVL